jgi:formamidopyrimidine-DNA glycosylase
MPELPEIETVKRGIASLKNKTIIGTVVRNPKLRYLIDINLHKLINNAEITEIRRRAKYLILDLHHNTQTHGYLIIHLGMSGSLTLTDNNVALKKHDHVDILFANGTILRYNDPRRFGCIIHTDNLENNNLLGHLGPEPLETDFNATYLLDKLSNKNSSIKQLIMDNQIVVGVGNIYACEALFMAKISPLRPGRDINKTEVDLLVKCIKEVLAKAIELGGSTLRDYKQADGSLGYFQNIHNVYGRSGKKCKTCGETILDQRLGQRNSFYCPKCQK